MSWTAPRSPGCDSPRVPVLADIEDCLTLVTATADVVAASLACAWLPGQVGRPHVRQVIAQLAGALGARLTWAAGGTQAAVTARQ